jgi:hypothetical protein
MRPPAPVLRSGILEQLLAQLETICAHLSSAKASELGAHAQAHAPLLVSTLNALNNSAASAKENKRAISGSATFKMLTRLLESGDKWTQEASALLWHNLATDVPPEQRDEVSHRMLEVLLDKYIKTKYETETETHAYLTEILLQIGLLRMRSIDSTLAMQWDKVRPTHRPPVPSEV